MNDPDTFGTEFSRRTHLQAPEGSQIGKIVLRQESSPRGAADCWK
jgi:hypothetical protein